MKKLVDRIYELPILPNEELNALIEKFQNNKKDAKLAEKIILHNLRFAALKAKSMFKKCAGRVSFDELLDDAAYGLIKAAESFDTSIGVDFIIFADFKIKNEFNKTVLSSSFIYVPKNIVQLRAKVFKLSRLLKKEATDPAVLSSLSKEDQNISPAVLDVLAGATNTINFGDLSTTYEQSAGDFSISEADNLLTMRIGENYSVTPEFDFPSLIADIYKLCRSDNEKNIFYLKTIEDKDNKEIAEKLNLSVSTVNHLYSYVLKRVRDNYIKETNYVA